MSRAFPSSFLFWTFVPQIFGCPIHMSGCRSVLNHHSHYRTVAIAIATISSTSAKTYRYKNVGHHWHDRLRLTFNNFHIPFMIIFMVAYRKNSLTLYLSVSNRIKKEALRNQYFFIDELQVPTAENKGIVFLILFLPVHGSIKVIGDRVLEHISFSL